MTSALALFLSFFALYLHTCAPHLAPYRDAGEMASLLGTLGVAHPPGYPLYTLIGRCALFIPLGNLVYRANFFSALCSAGSLVFLFLALRSRLKFLPALASVLFVAFSNPFWELSAVSEMYALGMLWFALLLYVTLALENFPLFAFLMALALGVRMDMLLLIPIFVVWFIRRPGMFVGRVPGSSRETPGPRLKDCRGDVVIPVFMFFLGASLFLYLMIRSRTNPLIDWGNPDTLLAVFNSATRKSYSGTLDLLSLSYARGENFPVNLRLYGEHLVQTFGWWGVALIGWGAFAAAKREKRLALFLGGIFAVTGPVFLFLANMPPNPHSMAIVEASYLIPDITLALFIGWGLNEIANPPVRRAALAVIGGLLLMNATAGYARASKRGNLYAHDYVENVWRSVPNHAVAVFHKDVQLFSLWASQLLDGRRKDVSLVATGLSGSPWYWTMMRRWGAAPCPEVSLKERGGWSRLKKETSPRTLVAGTDVELADASGLRILPRGVVVELADQDQPVPAIVPFLLPSLCLYRGRYVYGGTPDFFSTDLIGDVARSHHQQGLYALLHDEPVQADWFLRRSESLDPTFSRASADRAYVKFTKGDYAGAYALYETAVRKSEATLELAVRYKSLPSVMAGCRQDLSNAYSQWGAAAEKCGRLDQARQLYAASLNVEENAQAHYNLAVTYWGHDWAQVISHLRLALRLNPQMDEARAFLMKAEALERRKT